MTSEQAYAYMMGQKQYQGSLCSSCKACNTRYTSTGNCVHCAKEHSKRQYKARQAARGRL